MSNYYEPFFYRIDFDVIPSYVELNFLVAQLFPDLVLWSVVRALSISFNL